MRAIPFLLPLSSLLLAGCAQPPVAPESSLRESCSEPRPQVCTMIYAPVCALHADGSERTHASGCNACADDTVASHRSGTCEEDHTP